MPATAISRRAAAQTARAWFHSRKCMSGCDGTDHAVAAYRKLGREAAACVSLAELSVVIHANICHPHCEAVATHAPRFADVPATIELWELIHP